jgi:hypothetical protein
MAKTGFPGIGAPQSFESHVRGKHHDQAYGHGAIQPDAQPQGGSQAEHTEAQHMAVVVKHTPKRHGHKITLGSARYGV